MHIIYSVLFVNVVFLLELAEIKHKKEREISRVKFRHYTSGCGGKVARESTSSVSKTQSSIASQEISSQLESFDLEAEWSCEWDRSADWAQAHQAHRDSQVQWRPPPASQCSGQCTPWSTTAHPSHHQCPDTSPAAMSASWPSD